ncbi:MAG TPA: DUF1538 domain-containing protein [Peptococcaceae bacterium]|nr:DUF1538 domain-containing protein [Peptococcaceae bacterium]
MIAVLFEGFLGTIKDVTIALAPVVVLFLLAQVFLLKLPRRRLFRIAKGVIVCFFGLVLFLQGVHVGFMPVGEMMGITLGDLEYNWILIPLGFVLGFAAVMAEPAVQVLVDQIEQVSGGSINKKAVLLTLCLGVGISVALAMAKILMGIPLWYFILPGYVIAFILSKFVNTKFVTIAFDSGGVATGPMTVTFILSMTVGVAQVLEGRNPLLDGFGTVALVAMMPILTILLLGFLYTRKEKEES